MPTLADSHCNACLVQPQRNQMNHHQNDLIARGFSVNQKVNLGGVGKDGCKTETDASLQQFQSLLLSEQRCFIAVCLRRLGAGNS